MPDSQNTGTKSPYLKKSPRSSTKTIPRSDRKRKSHPVRSPKADEPVTPSLPPSQADKIKNFAAFCKVKFSHLFSCYLFPKHLFLFQRHLSRRKSLQNLGL